MRGTIITWNNKKWFLPKGKLVAVPNKNKHRPPKQVYYDVLRKAGKSLCVCECCGSEQSIIVHHLDRNPWNNKLENLKVLCAQCHQQNHFPDEQGIHHEFEGTKKDVNPLDDPETRKFLGIKDEFEGVIDD